MAAKKTEPSEKKLPKKAASGRAASEASEASEALKAGGKAAGSIAKDAGAQSAARDGAPASASKTDEGGGPEGSKASQEAASTAPGSSEAPAVDVEALRKRLQITGRNDPCPCGSGNKYKRCHLQQDELATAPAPVAPDPSQHIANGWRLFEMRRPGAAEKEFRAALELDAGLHEARLGVGLSKLSAADGDGARATLDEVVKAGEGVLGELAQQHVTDAFTRREAQPFLRAAHALGCLAYDKERYEDCVSDLTRVYGIDAGALGSEARLVAGKALLKLKRITDAIAVLEPVAVEASGARAHMGLALCHFLGGDQARARKSLEQALAYNAHLGKAILGHIRRKVDSPIGTAPGSREEAVIYAQAHGDVWDEAAKEFLEQALAARAASPDTARTDSATTG
jgi:tetratricopeptide (TPR) repeat protein